MIRIDFTCFVVYYRALIMWCCVNWDTDVLFYVCVYSLG